MKNTDNNLPAPINEAMTEYFTMKSFKYSEIDSIRMAGYPLEIQIMMALSEKISEKDLLDIYFSQNEGKLKSLMKKYFPNTNYTDFLSKMTDIFNSTFHVNGAFNSFDKGLINHEKVKDIRKMLGLNDRKFTVIF